MLESNVNEVYARLEHNIPKSKCEEVKRLVSNADDSAYHKIMQMRLESKNLFKSHYGLAVFVCGLIGTLFLLLNIIIYGWLTPYTVNKIQYTSYVSIGLKNISTEYENLNKYFLFEMSDYEEFTKETENYQKLVEAYKSKKATYDAKNVEYEAAKAAVEERGGDPAKDEKCQELANELAALMNNEEEGLTALEAQAKLSYEKIFVMSQVATAAFEMQVHVLEYMDEQYAQFAHMNYGSYISDSNNGSAENPEYSLKAFADQKINGVSLNDFTFTPLIEMTQSLEDPTYEDFDITTSDPVANYFKPVEEVVNENLSVISQMNATSKSLDGKCSSMSYLNKTLGLILLVFDVIALVVVAIYFGWMFLYCSIEAKEANYQSVKEILS